MGFLHLTASVESVEGSGSERCTICLCQATLLRIFASPASLGAEASWGGWSGEANFLGGSDGGNVADGVGLKCIALRTPTERAAMADAPCCDG